MKKTIAGLLLASAVCRAEDLPDIEKMGSKYWAQGRDSDLSVVQNRKFYKNKKLELTAFGGVISNDPFVDIKQTGGSLGFHINEYFAVRVSAWKCFVTPSSAMATLNEQVGAVANTNEPSYTVDGEVLFAPIYGKLSFLGAKIIYYDLHVLGGLGTTMTESGSYLTPLVGIGQQVFITKRVSIPLDYRIGYYRDAVLAKSENTRRIAGYRDTFSYVFTLGVSLMFGF
jgi:outer membrane beta-barrel protein